jgi:hypothetical protein
MRAGSVAAVGSLSSVFPEHRDVLALTEGGHVRILLSEEIKPLGTAGDYCLGSPPLCVQEILG